VSYQSPYQAFVFEGYSFDTKSNTAEFRYSFDGQRHFTERLVIPVEKVGQSYNSEALEKALQLSFYLAGVSYYKAFPTKQIIFKAAQPDAFQANFLQIVYTKGLSQFLFENNLSLESAAQFVGEGSSENPVEYRGSDIIALQSGGKDSLLLATLLEEKNQQYTPWYISSGSAHPSVLDRLAFPVQVVRREIDKAALRQAAEDGGLNGHVPVTYIVLSYALIEAILQGKSAVLSAIGVEGEEPHEFIGNLPVNHQWSKTWEAEQLFAQYVSVYISPDLQIGSPLRGFSELRIAEMFVEKCWQKYGAAFSSCNRANYKQGSDNTRLTWCGECPKCANSYVLFAPFVEPVKLQKLFNGQNLFEKPMLKNIFKGLLGVDGVMKPFECVGETDELRLAYHMAQEKYGSVAGQLPFEVPVSTFDYKRLQVHQPWAFDVIDISS
jgi:hypothetical protein